MEEYRFAADALQSRRQEAIDWFPGRQLPSAVAIPGHAGTSASAVADAALGDRGVRERQAGGRSGCDPDRGGSREGVVRVAGPFHVTPR